MVSLIPPCRTASQPPPDAAAVAATGGKITVAGVRAPVLWRRSCGFWRTAAWKSGGEKTAPNWRGTPAGSCAAGSTCTPTDGLPSPPTSAPLAAAVLLTADRPSEIYDHLFANRFACAAGFAALGADCRAEGAKAVDRRQRSLAGGPGAGAGSAGRGGAAGGGAGGPGDHTAARPGTHPPRLCRSAGGTEKTGAPSAVPGGKRRRNAHRRPAEFSPFVPK